MVGKVPSRIEDASPVQAQKLDGKLLLRKMIKLEHGGYLVLRPTLLGHTAASGPIEQATMFGTDEAAMAAKMFLARHRHTIVDVEVTYRVCEIRKSE